MIHFIITVVVIIIIIYSALITKVHTCITTVHGRNIKIEVRSHCLIKTDFKKCIFSCFLNSDGSVTMRKSSNSVFHAEEPTCENAHSMNFVCSYGSAKCIDDVDRRSKSV